MPSTSGKTFGCADLMSVKLLTISMVCVCVCVHRWVIFLIVSCVVLLVVLCNLLGLLLGPLGLRPNADPTNRSRTADCAGTFFMM